MFAQKNVLLNTLFYPERADIHIIKTNHSAGQELRYRRLLADTAALTSVPENSSGDLRLAKKRLNEE